MKNTPGQLAQAEGLDEELSLTRLNILKNEDHLRLKMTCLKGLNDFPINGRLRQDIDPFHYYTRHLNVTNQREQP